MKLPGQQDEQGEGEAGERFLRDMRDKLRQTQAVLREHAFFDRSYYSKTTADLVRLQFEEIWVDVECAVEALVNNEVSRGTCAGARCWCLAPPFGASVARFWLPDSAGSWSSGGRPV